MKKAILLFSFFFLFLMIFDFAHAATYFIDFQNGSDANTGTNKTLPWKRCPGMTGYSGNYKHVVGDVFVFKGGVTWPANCFPFSVLFSGSQQSPDSYTADNAWHNGNLYSPPVFDGGGVIPPNAGLVTVDNRSWVGIIGIKIINVGKPGASSQARAIKANPTGEGIEISNCEIIPYGNHAIVLNYNPTSSIREGARIFNNKISKSANSIEIATSPQNIYLISNIRIYANQIFDPSNQLIGGDHGDGIHIWAGSKKPNFKDVRIHSNKFYGDWAGRDEATSNTANIYLEGCCTGATIYNNSHTFSNTKTMRKAYLFAPGFIVVGGGENIDVFNNSLNASNMSNGIGNFGVQTGIKIDNVNNVSIRANAILGTRIGIWVPNCSGTIDIDYNVVKPRSSGDGTFGINPKNKFLGTLYDWQGEGFDLNGKEADPKFVGNSNLVLQSSSPCIDALPVNSAPAKIFSTDINEKTRPQGKAWDVGAYEGDSDMQQPTGIRVLK